MSGTERSSEGRRGHTVFYGLVFFLVAIVVYLLWIVRSMEAVMFDTHEIYNNVQRFLGSGSHLYYWKRPPLLPWLVVPAFRFFDLEAAIGISRLIAVGFYAALLFASFRLFRIFWDRFQSIAGTVLLGCNALLFHCTPFYKEDVPATLWVTLFFWSYLRPQKDRLGSYALSGLFLGLAATTRYNALPWIMGTVLLRELLKGKWQKNDAGLRLPRVPEPWKKIFWFFVFPIVFFWGVATVSLAIAAHLPLGKAVVEMAECLWSYPKLAASGDSPLWNFMFLQTSFTWPLILLFFLGVFAVWRQRERGGGVMGCWIVFFLSQQSLLQHHEARYLFPMFPPVCFFIIRGVAFFWRQGMEVSSRIRLGRDRSRGITVFLLCLMFLPYGISFLKECKKFQDPFYRIPFVREVSQAADKLAGSNQIFWAGKMYPLHPKEFIFHPLDPVSYIYHFYNHAVQLYTNGKRVAVIADSNDPIYSPLGEGGVLFVAGLGEKVKDGDVCIINPNPQGHSAGNIPSELFPLLVERFRVLKLAPVVSDEQGTLRFSAASGAVRVTMKPVGNMLLVEGGRIPEGIYELYVNLKDQAFPFLKKVFRTKDGYFSTVINTPDREITGCFLLTADQVLAFQHPES